MAELTRNADFLRLTASTARRVRNLETGVHPTGTDVNYYDTYLPTDITPSTGWQVASGGVSSYQPQWQRRVGVITFLGGIRPGAGRLWSDMAAEEKIFNLPGTARPLTEQTFNLALSATPWFAQIRAETNGDVYLYKPPGAPANGTTTLWLAGPNWTVN